MLGDEAVEAEMGGSYPERHCNVWAPRGSEVERIKQRNASPSDGGGSGGGLRTKVTKRNKS